MTIIHYYSKLFTGVLRRAHAAAEVRNVAELLAPAEVEVQVLQALQTRHAAAEICDVRKLLAP